MWLENSDAHIFHLDDLQLTIHPGCCLVMVTNSSRGGQSRIADLPDWVFDSKHVIWLTEEDKPILYRAQNGEAIRNRLQLRRQACLQAAG